MSSFRLRIPRKRELKFLIILHAVVILHDLATFALRPKEGTVNAVPKPYGKAETCLKRLI